MQGCGEQGPRRYTVTVYPSSLDADLSVYESIDETHPIENAFGPANSSNYAVVHWIKGADTHTYVYLNFDLSAIPLDATIISVACSIRVTMNGTQSTRWRVRETMLTSGTTQKSSVITPSMQSVSTFSDAGTWTPAELHEAKWMTHIQRRTSYVTTDYYLTIYGATLTVTYEI